MRLLRIVEQKEDLQRGKTSRVAGKETSRNWCVVILISGENAGVFVRVC